MDKDVKTRRVVRDIKTTARRTGAANAARTVAIKTREAAYGTVSAAPSEQGQTDEREPI